MVWIKLLSVLGRGFKLDWLANRLQGHEMSTTWNVNDMECPLTTILF